MAARSKRRTAPPLTFRGESGDVQLNGGTIRNSVTGVRVADAGDSEIDLKAVTFENNTDDIQSGK